MNPIALRKQIGLEEKLGTLAAEFERWRQLSKMNREFEKHQSQVIVLAGHLSGLWQTTDAIFVRAKCRGSILQDGRNLESLVLGLRRIWEFFRSKLAQRFDAESRVFLQVADELAWACYRPPLDLSRSGRREPPLVFLNGGLSPYALSRGQAFTAEDVAGEVLGGPTYDPILHHLPIPVVGVPWYQVAHLPDLPVVAHETGHVVEDDFGLHEDVVARVNDTLGGAGKSAHAERWRAWSKEAFADLWGCLTLGPAFVSSLIDFLAVPPNLIQNEIATADGKYPTAHLRVMLCVEALAFLDFEDEAKNLHASWSQTVNTHSMPGFDDDPRLVARAILGFSFPAFGGETPLRDIPDVRFTRADHTYAQAAAQEVHNKPARPPQWAATIRQTIAAARYLYDLDPALYAAKAGNTIFLTKAHSMIKPGTRAGERVLTEQDKSDLQKDSKKRGEAWFDDFAKWADASAVLGNPTGEVV
jgi:hypothetical protein